MEKLCQTVGALSKAGQSWKYLPLLSDEDAFYARPIFNTAEPFPFQLVTQQETASVRLAWRNPQEVTQQLPHLHTLHPAKKPGMYRFIVQAQIPEIWWRFEEFHFHPKGKLGAGRGIELHRELLIQLQERHPTPDTLTCTCCTYQPSPRSRPLRRNRRPHRRRSRGSTRRRAALGGRLWRWCAGHPSCPHPLPGRHPSPPDGPPPRRRPASGRCRRGSLSMVGACWSSVGRGTFGQTWV